MRNFKVECIQSQLNSILQIPSESSAGGNPLNAVTRSQPRWQCGAVRLQPAPREGCPSRVLGFSQQWQKDLCGITQYQKDKVTPKQVSKNKTTGMKWEK